MSNRAFLVGGHTPITPGITEQGGNYNPNTEILAGASNSIPILWCSLFEESDLAHHPVDEYQIPTLVTPIADARQRLITRSPRIHETFPHSTEAIENWTRLLNSADFEFIKVDALEVWMLYGDSFEGRLKSSMRWYHTGDDNDLTALTALAECSYDFAQRKLVVPEGYIVDLCFHGYRWVREVPWLEP